MTNGLSPFHDDVLQRGLKISQKKLCVDVIEIISLGIYEGISFKEISLH